MKVAGRPILEAIVLVSSETKVAWTKITTVKIERNGWIRGMLRSSNLRDTGHMAGKERRY